MEGLEVRLWQKAGDRLEVRSPGRVKRVTHEEEGVAAGGGPRSVRGQWEGANSSQTDLSSQTEQGDGRSEVRGAEGGQGDGGDRWRSQAPFSWANRSHTPPSTPRRRPAAKTAPLA